MLVVVVAIYDDDNNDGSAVNDVLNADADISTYAQMSVCHLTNR